MNKGEIWKLNFAVVYYSRGGNTRKLADAIANELEVKAVDVEADSPDVSGADVLVVGSGTYGGKPGKPIVTFLESLKEANGKRAACFASCAGDASKSLTAMQEILKAKGYVIIDCYSCFGRFAFFAKRGHPTAEELDQAKEFARKLKNSA